MRLIALAGMVALGLAVALAPAEAQRGGKGPGKGAWGKGAGKMKLPPLEVEDVKAEGSWETASLLPNASDQPRLAVTDEFAARLVDYSATSHALKFVVHEFGPNQTRTVMAALPKDCPGFEGAPRMAADGGAWAAVSQGSGVVFVELKTGKVKVAAQPDGAGAKAPTPPKGKDKGKGGKEAPAAGPRAKVYGGAGGKFALAVASNYDSKAKDYTSNDAVLHSAEGKSVTLKWSHSAFGVPPAGRDAVFAVAGNEVVVLVVKPVSAGDFGSAHELRCLVFDAAKGDLKDVQSNPEKWSGRTASRFSIAPDGQYLVAQPEDGLHGYVVKRGTWERGYKTDYFDPLVGFAPEGSIGIFLANKTPERAALLAVELATGKELWATTVTHAEATGEGDAEPFTAVGPGARTVAAKFGIIKGQSSELPQFLFAEKAAEFEPLCLSYDPDGKLVAVLARDRVIVLEAKSREELHSVSFETPMPKGALGEFVAFSPKSDRVLACVRNQGAWMVDLATNRITQTLKPLPGTWARPLPDLSGIVYSQAKEAGGNVMLQPLDGGDAKRIYRCGFKDSMAVCYWVSEKGDQFLVAEREVGEGHLLLVDDKEKVLVEYDVKDVDPMYVGDTTVQAFVTKSRKAVLINEINKWEYTGINCTVVSPDPGECIEENFSSVFKSSDLPGSSTYGTTAAAPFFGGLYSGNEAGCSFACPAGLLVADIAKGSFKLYAWSRAPKGFAALSPKGKEFFVAGAAGLTTYKVK
ncbi:MAG: hypothetical protein IT463_10775 [Planctomycetes bacterium]|nr:hypothetical protein [Planctomycetota bacterium]